VRIRVVGFIVVIAALLAGAGAAGAATVSGSLSVLQTTSTSVTFTVTAQRTCVTDEQCDYYADLEAFDGGGDCPTTYPADPSNVWNGDVQNTGPTTETGTITPHGWQARVPPTTPTRLCLFIFADNAYYYAGGTTVTRPDGPPAPGTTTTPPPGGATTPGTTTPPGGTTRPVTGSSRSRTPATPAVRTVALTKASASAKAALKKAYGKRFTQGRRYKASCRRVSKAHVRCAVSWQHGGTWRGTVDVTGAIRKGRQVLVTRVRVRKPKG
jgi:hypothetical protein